MVPKAVKKGTNQEDIQEMNRSLLIRLLRNVDICSRAELSKKSGLKQATITYIINDFIKWGLVKETGLIEGEKGRRSIGITLNSEKYKVFGVRLTRKYFTVGLYDIAGKEYTEIKQPIGMHLGSQIVMEEIKLEIRKLFETVDGEVMGIGVAIPGPFFASEGRIGLMTEFPGWEKIYLRDELQNAFGIPVYLEHDANAGALAEWWLGHNRMESGTLVYVAAGQGIGAGVIIDGKIFRGALGVAGEIGHTSINFNGPKCECGNRGCLYKYSSSTALMTEIRNELPNHPESALKENCSLEEVFCAVSKGDPVAVHAVEKIAWYLGFGLVNVINNFNPDRIIIGDDLAKGGDLLIKRVKAAVKEHCLPSLYNKVVIELSSFAKDQVLIGAGAFVADKILQRPAVFSRQSN